VTGAKLCVAGLRCLTLSTTAHALSFRHAMVEITRPYVTDGKGETVGLHQWGCNQAEAAASGLSAAQRGLMRSRCGAFYSCALLAFKHQYLNSLATQQPSSADDDSVQAVTTNREVEPALPREVVFKATCVGCCRSSPSVFLIGVSVARVPRTDTSTQRCSCAITPSWE
jgi:hypothetical protein